MNTLDLAQRKTILKKIASTGGGEWCGPCPECGGNDRFRVWPNENSGKGGYWCRSCGKAGDNIQFLVDFEGMTFKEACAFLRIEKPSRTAEQPPPVPRAFTPQQHQGPAQLWQDRAEKFVSWAQENLLQKQEILDWLAARGINKAAAAAARLGWNSGEKGKDIFRARAAWGLPEQIKDNGKPRMLWIPIGLVIPYCAPVDPGQSATQMILRLRIRRPDDQLKEKTDARYYVVPGSAMNTMVIGAHRTAFVVVESELDAIACAAASDLCGAVALGSAQQKPDAAAYDALKRSHQILNALDFDRAGAKAYDWWAKTFNTPEREDLCERWPVPQGKDPGEAHKLGIDLKRWIETGLPPVVTLQRAPEKPQAARPSPVRAPKPSEPDINPPENAPALLVELWGLLRANPAVKIINTKGPNWRFAILRNGKPAGGGRIQNLVLCHPEVTDYVVDHPAEEITWKNLFM